MRKAAEWLGEFLVLLIVALVAVAAGLVAFGLFRHLFMWIF